MADSPEKRGEEDGRVVYSRAAGGDVPRETVGAGLARMGREQVAPALPVLVVSFLVLVGLVYALGRLSVGELDDVSNETQRLQQQQSGRVQFLLKLRTSLTNLDFEARDRGTRERQGGIINPFDHKLTVARDEAKRALKLLEQRAEARTPQGQALIAEAAEFIQSTEEPEGYSIEGFEKFRKLDRRVEELTNEADGRQEEINNVRVKFFNAARDRINTLRNFAVLLAALVAAATAWEVQRRFRQVGRSLAESRREREFSSQMLEGMVTAVAAIDGRDRVRSANRAFFRLFPRAAVGASVYDESLAPPDALRMFAAAAGSRVEEAAYRGRWSLTPEGEPEARHFEVYSSPLHLDDGHGQILTLFDVTDAAHNEAELRRKTALAAVGQAAAQVAHEIKNPLGSIRLGVAMLRDMTAGEEAHSTIDLVERGIEHLNKLTIDVTQYSHEKPLALAPTDLHNLLDASLELVSDNLRGKRTPIERGYADEPLAGELDADQLRQVFVNVIANAVDASPEGSPVRISTMLIESRRNAAAGEGADGGGGRAAGPAIPHARVTVEDRGAGMDERTRARIFEPFFTTKRRGTGLGLAIVKKIVEQHGGTITVESEPGAGTRFHVELPLRGAPAGES